MSGKETRYESEHTFYPSSYAEWEAKLADMEKARKNKDWPAYKRLSETVNELGSILWPSQVDQNER